MKVTVKDDRKKWDELVKKVHELSAKGGNAVDIGLFGEQGSDLVIYAASNEFGTDTIPERSFLRSTFDEQKKEIRQKVDRAKVDILLGKVTRDRFLTRTGLWFERLVKEKIERSKDWAVPNAPSTIAQKTTSSGVGDQPLVDTGRMRQSITHKIVKSKV